MKLTLISILLAAPLLAYGQIMPVPASSQNPFTDSVVPAPMSPNGKSAQVMPTPLPGMAAFNEQLLPLDAKSMLEGLILVGRTSTHAVIGLQFPAGVQLGFNTPGRTLKQMTVKNGADFYLGNRKVRLVLDPESTGIFITEAINNGAVLWYTDIDAQRTVYPTVVQNEQIMSAGFGVGQGGRALSGGQSSIGSFSGGSPFPSGNPQQQGVR